MLYDYDSRKYYKQLVPKLEMVFGYILIRVGRGEITQLGIQPDGSVTKRGMWKWKSLERIYSLTIKVTIHQQKRMIFLLYKMQLIGELIRLWTECCLLSNTSVGDLEQLISFIYTMLTAYDYLRRVFLVQFSLQKSLRHIICRMTNTSM